MNKDNENNSNHVDENLETSESIESGDSNQLISENDADSNSDCLENESIGGGDSPNTFVQSGDTVEDIRDQVNEYEENSPSDESLVVSIDEEMMSIETTEILDDNEDVNSSEATNINESRVNNNQNKFKLNRKQVILLLVLILAVGGVFVMIQKPFSTKTKEHATNASVSKTDEKLIKKSFDQILNYYDNGADGKKLKKDADFSSLDELKKDIDKITDKKSRDELKSQFYNLEQDIKKSKTSSKNNSSSNSTISYNVFFNNL